ncbi:MAG: Flp family type IVb pilin [Solirubrobacteraceae bacterium]
MARKPFQMEAQAMFKDRIASLVKDDEQGQGLVEYALILLILSIAAIATMAILGTSVSGLIQDVVDVFP